MNQRSTYWLGVAGLLVAMLALGLGVVAVVRANNSSAASSSDGMGTSMSGSQEMMSHMAPAPMDGVPDVTQAPIKPGASFTYEFAAMPAGLDSACGTLLYHSHVGEGRQFGLGPSGTFVIEPKQAQDYDVERTLLIQEWNLNAATGATRPAMEMQFDGRESGFFTATSATTSPTTAPTLAAS